MLTSEEIAKLREFCKQKNDDFIETWLSVKKESLQIAIEQVNREREIIKLLEMILDERC